MDVSLSRAANAYGQAMKRATGGGGEEDAAAAGGAGGFSDLLANQFAQVKDTLQAAENVKNEAVTGRVDVADLVTAIANAELTLNTVVAVRDRVISAYQDIIRMPI